MDIQKLAKEILAAGEAVFSRIKSIHGLDGAVSALPEVLKAVEEKAAEVKGMSGEDKKKLAVEIINALVDIPVVPEFIEGKIISLAIDAIISALNKLLGKNWLEKIEPSKPLV